VKKILVIVVTAVLSLIAGTALADLTYTQGSGTTLFDFICFATKHCTAHVPIDSSGTEKATAANPWVVDVATSGNNLYSAITAPYPIAAVPITASATGTTLATTATLAAVGGKTTYICGFSIRANATAAVTGNSTVSGTVTGTMNFTQWTAPNGAGLGVTEEVFQPCVPATGLGVTISVISAAAGGGGVVSVSAWGFQQ
jgi:hypothetical protein